ncbi:MAG: rhomboid family intramembrane serine protease [Planctomycetes bacterium]|nr:rhomboid family intramembrane serine protease [Planctomycetota bacterium]
MDRDLRLSSGRQRAVRRFRPTAVGTFFVVFLAVAILDLLELSLVQPHEIGLSVSAPRLWTVLTFLLPQGHLLLLVINLGALYCLGRGLECHYGSLRFAFLYLGTSILSGLSAFGIARIQGPSGALPAYVCGAAGGTFGLLTLSRLLWPDDLVLGRFAMRNAAIGGFFILLCCLLLIEYVVRQQSVFELGLRWQATGVGFALLLRGLDGRLIALLERRRLDRRLRAFEEELRARERVDELLERIARQGIGSLSRREFHFLRSASRYYRRRT